MSKKSNDVLRVLIVEDHLLTRMGIKTLLQRRTDIQVIGEAADGEDAVKMAGSLSPDLILMDVGMPVLDGIEAARQIRDKYPTIKVIMLTSHDNEHDIFASFAAGAAGYCLKSIESERLCTAIAAINAGDVWIDSAIASKILNHYGPVPPATQIRPALAPPSDTKDEFRLYEPLSPRERQVLELLVEGLNNRQIADRLIVSLATAKTHVRNILNKLAVDDRTKAAVTALRHGLVQ